jgi:hypothetical protein
MFWRNILSPSKGFPEDGDSMFLRNVGTYVQAVVVLGGLVVIVLSFGLKVRGYKPGRQCIFKDVKNQQHDFLRRGSKAVDHMSQEFTAC